MNVEAHAAWQVWRDAQIERFGKGQIRRIRHDSFVAGYEAGVAAQTARFRNARPVFLPGLSGMTPPVPELPVAPVIDYLSLATLPKRRGRHVLTDSPVDAPARRRAKPAEAAALRERMNSAWGRRTTGRFPDWTTPEGLRR